MSTVEIIIHEHDGPVGSGASLILPSNIDLPPEDPRSLLYLLDSELSRLELEDQLYRRAEAEAEAREAAAVRAQAEQLSELLDDEALLDALGRRMLAIGGYEAPPVFLDPVYFYETQRASTSQLTDPQRIGYARSVHAPNIIVPEGFGYVGFSDETQHQPRHSDFTRRSLPRLYAHEQVSDRIHRHYEDHALDWLAYELLRGRSTSKGAAPQAGLAAASAGPAAPKATTQGSDGGEVWIIDDGSVGDSLSASRESSVPVTDRRGAATLSYSAGLPLLDRYEVEDLQADDDELILTPDNSEKTQSGTSSQVLSADETQREHPAAPKHQAPTVMDEDEERRLETEGVILRRSDGEPPRKSPRHE